MPFIDYFRKRAVVDEPVTVPVGRAAQDRRGQPRKNVPPGTSVLIIDDSKTMVAAPGKMLRENHFTTLEALDVEAGREVLKKK